MKILLFLSLILTTPVLAQDKAQRNEEKYKVNRATYCFDVDDVQKRSQELIETAETRQVMIDTLTEIHENYT